MTFDPSKLSKALFDRIERDEKSNATNYRTQAQTNCDQTKRQSNERVVALVNSIRKQDQIQTLDNRKKVRPRGKNGVAVVVCITSYRSRELDDDNLIGGAKPLRDAISKSVGIDDGSNRIRFEYRQLVTTGTPGTHVLVTHFT